jgi:hypothetical protein
VTAAVLVAAFGNQWVSDWIDKHMTTLNTPNWLLQQLTSPRWTVDFSGSNDHLRSVIASDVRAVLTVVLVYVLLVSFRKTFPEGFSGFVLGWSTLIFASAIATFVAAFIPTGARVLTALMAAGAASLYGLFVGWVVGFITSVGRNIPLIGKTSDKSKASAAA